MTKKLEKQAVAEMVTKMFEENAKRFNEQRESAITEVITENFCAYYANELKSKLNKNK